MPKPFTVIFFIDADKAVETFVEHVTAPNGSEAWEIAKKQALDSGCSSSGYSLDADDFEHATEIITLDGHHEGTKQWS